MSLQSGTRIGGYEIRGTLGATAMIGQRIGPDEVVAKLGEGGMGEVYRAHDATLKRDVALKVLPAELAMLVRKTRNRTLVSPLSRTTTNTNTRWRQTVIEIVFSPCLCDSVARPWTSSRAEATRRESRRPC